MTQVLITRPLEPAQQLAGQLAEQEAAIVAELNAVQGKPADIGGYYRPDRDKTTAVMRPSVIFNGVLDSV